AARRMVVPIACHVVTCPRSSKKRLNTWRGPGRTYSGRQPVQTTICQAPTAMAMAANFGHVADHARASRDRRSTASPPRASRPASSASRSSGSRASRRGASTTAMAGDLLAQMVGDLTGQLADGGRLDASGPLDLDGELGCDAPRTAGEEHDAIGEAGG